MTEGTPGVAPQFESSEQQEQAAELGLWTFLATEVLFFGGLFLAYTIYRVLHPDVYRQGSHEMNLVLGTLNTAVLLTSSLTMVLGVDAARNGRGHGAARWLVVTAGAGLVFLAIKAVEYRQHFRAGSTPGKSMFFYLYYAMTGLHALHLIIGCVLVAVVAWRARKGAYSARYLTPVELTGLYWHFVDLVWIFLFPLFYLVERHP